MSTPPHTLAGPPVATVDPTPASAGVSDASTAALGGSSAEVTGLDYTPRQLSMLFVWLLGGDFVLSFFEQIFGRFIPLFAEDLHASNKLIGLMSGSIAGLANLLVLPMISLASDRHRGRLGRRIPFLLWSTPCAVISLVLVSFAPEISHALQSFLPFKSAAGSNTLTLGLLCLFVVSYHLWNMVLVNAYNWLIRDVVPPAIIGRFLSWFRVVATLAMFLFLYGVFPHVLSHRHEVFIIVGGLYAAVFLLMCWKIREGGYPPPPPRENTNLFNKYREYFRQCLTVPLYRHYFAAYLLMTLAITSATPFTTLFARNVVGLNMDDLGKSFAYGTLTSALLYPLLGWICDRYKPIRLTLVGMVGYAAAMILAYALIHGRTSWFVYLILSALPASAWGLGNAALTMELFPRQQFGQFSAGLNVLSYAGLIVGNYLIGALMDFVHSQYQVAYIWSATLAIVALVPMWRVYRGWREHGGPGHYVPPLPPAQPPARATQITAAA